MATPQEIRESLELPEIVNIQLTTTFETEGVIEQLLYEGADPTAIDRETLLDYMRDEAHKTLEEDWITESRTIDEEGEDLY